jgi:REP element-mobilizing transposase RayT
MFDIGTYSKLYIHIVFGVRNRENSIVTEIEEDVFRYMSGIVKHQQQKLLAINGMPDHIHMAINFKPVCNISDLVREIKKSSTPFIRDLTKNSKFHWQEGFGGFSIGYEELDELILYIQHQKEHHKKLTYEEEYNRLLKENGLEQRIFK